MARTAARFTQADVARSIRAAKQAGAGSIRLFPDGTIKIDLQADPAVEKTQNPIEDEEEAVL